MSKPRERSHETPFDSRRTDRVTVVTPRNPVADRSSSAPPEKKDDAGRSVTS